MMRTPIRRRGLRGHGEMLKDPMPAREPETEPWEVKLATFGARLDSFDSELRQQGKRQEEGFERLDRTLASLFSKVDAQTNRPPPWGLIVSAFVGICTILVGIGGLGLTVAGGLALWANAYFGKNISIAEQRADTAHERIDRVAERVDTKISELQEFEWQTRAYFSSWPQRQSQEAKPVVGQ